MPKRRANGEGTIYERKDGRWCAEYIDKSYKRRTLYGKSQQEVKNKLKESIRQMDAGMNMDKNKITLAAWLVEWLEVYSKPTVRPNTYSNNYCVVHRHIIPAFPRVLLKDLRADMLQKFFNEKTVGGRLDSKPGALSVGTLKRLRGLLITALDTAVNIDIISRNPARKIKLPNLTKTQVEVLTLEEQEKLESAALQHDNPLAFCVVLALYTGLRIGELLALKLADIDLQGKEIHVNRTIYRAVIPNEATQIIIGEPKTEAGKRTIPLPDFMIDLLSAFIEKRNYIISIMKDYWGESWEDNGFLFVSMLGTTPDKRSIWSLYQRILRDAGIKKVKFHALRHTFATRCVEAGFDIRTLADVLGHADVKMTLNTYTHVLPDHKRNNMNKLTPLFQSKLPSKQPYKD